MRLKQVKLSGFKSFVDATTLHFPSAMAGVVGPNGCGKSNIIDAVRWVMGETSKHIRGDTVEDVIFNGSSSRKPVAQASIELVFDNTVSPLGGEYASYNEISIRRAASRDGQSNYFLNGTRCRRRDIVDIFLGTGLGPRSYAIIEQGTISRLIEAKPEELRVYLEEAAGISKYKERRRETENRIRHTRENLDRLNDLIEEVAKHIEHLERQAKAAERYKELKKDERQVKTELFALRWREQQKIAAQRKRELEHQETEIEQVIAKIRSCETEIEKLREAHSSAMDKFNHVQGNYYQLGGNISRTEQSIQHVKDLTTRQEQELKEAQEEWARSEELLKNQLHKIEEIETRLTELGPHLAAAKEELNTNIKTLSDAEQKMTIWQDGWEELSLKIAQPTQVIEIQTSRIEQLQHQIDHMAERKMKLVRDRDDLSRREKEKDISILEQELSAVDTQLQQTEPALRSNNKNISNLRVRYQEGLTALSQEQDAYHQVQAQLASLTALEEDADSHTNPVAEWLKANSLARAKSLAGQVKPKLGWEQAVATVLGSNLQSVCVQDIERAIKKLPELSKGTLSLIDTNEQAQNVAAHASLWSKVETSLNLAGIIGNVLVAESLNDALTMRRSFEDGESVVTRDGIWMGKNWVRVSRPVSEDSNIFYRRKKIDELSKLVAEKVSRVNLLEEKLKSIHQELQSSEKNQDDVQIQLNALQKSQIQLRSDLTRNQTEQEQLTDRLQQLDEFIEEIDIQSQDYRHALKEAQDIRARAQEKLDQLSLQKSEFLQNRDSALFKLDNVRSQDISLRDQAHQYALDIESLRSARNVTQESVLRTKQQSSQLQARVNALTTAIQDSRSPIVQLSEELKHLLGQRVHIEHELTAARTSMQDIEDQIRKKETDRVEIEQTVDEKRNQLNELRLAWQEVNVRSKTIQEQLSEYQLDAEALLAQIDTAATVQGWEEQVASIERKINRLGPINLAAIDEFEEQRKRKEYLDSQHADLTEALDTLENAIRKIDRETKDRFKETFEKVNSHLNELFPRLFGGGKAFLEMTEDDLLSTGISLMARPPGKRLSNIHLMSGGEKALTAVALVFSLFSLNPAPFCLLDEVDAPLDDANVGRFCDLLKEMSENIQFIYITHNKITMESAQQLLGITMHEPGVSRVVSVDVDEAARMAAAS